MKLFKDIVKTAQGYIGVCYKEDLTLVFIVLPFFNYSKVDFLINKKILNKYSCDISKYQFREKFRDYFNGNKPDFSNMKFDIDFFNPTSFQRQVWKSTYLVPYAKTITYKELGIMLGCGAYRAIGNALSKNPLPIIIPCHRIVSQNSIGGFSALKGISLKKNMILLESK